MYEYSNGHFLCTTNIYKIIKPVFSTLHQIWFHSTAYIDDLLLVNDSKEEWTANVKETLMEKLGFIINNKKISV